MSADNELTCTKSHRLQLMQKTLMEQQQQLIRQRESLQHQQLLLSQRAQERNATPQSLAQLFAELHESRHLQVQPSEPRLMDASQEQKHDGQVADNYRASAGGASGSETGVSTGRDYNSACGAGTTFGREVEGREGTASLCWPDKRRVLRAVALLDAGTVLKYTLRSLGRSSSTLQVAGSLPFPEGSRLGVDKEGAEGANVFKACHCRPGLSWNSRQNLRGQYDLTDGKVLQVHGQPLPAAALFAGFSSWAPWRHCLRVTLSARRCAIRTRCCWKALLPLFPRRNAYTPAAVLSDDDVDAYTDIGPRAPPLALPAVCAESWKPSREPFTTPGLYVMTEKGGSIIAAWAVAADNEGHLRRRVASVESAAGGVSREAAACKRKRPAQQPLLPAYVTSEELGTEPGSVVFNELNALEEWYSKVAQEPLTAHKLQRLTLGREADSCGCSCSICVGSPCRVRLAWRRQLMAFEVAVDKPAAARHHSDSSVEDSDRDEPDVGSRKRLAAAGRSRKGRWEWCRRCPLGCRMQLCLILHELYQPLVLTGQGLRSALAHVLLRLRRYVTLSPLASDFLMQRVGEIRLSSAAERGKAGARNAAVDERRAGEAVTPLEANWSTRDWAEVCWQRREHRRLRLSPSKVAASDTSKVFASDNLDRSVALLSMLSSPLLHSGVAQETIGSAHLFSAVDNEYCSTYPLLPQPRDSMLADGRAQGQWRRLDVSVSQGRDLKLANGLETLALRAAAAAAVGMSCGEDAEETTNNINFSYPVSIASSPSVCSTPPTQSSRPRIGRCFAIPFGSSASSHNQTSEKAPDDSTSLSFEECKLHIHCDGMAKARQYRGAERDEGGRGGYGNDANDGDFVDVSPRRLRRAQRARLTSEEPRLAPPRRVDIPRRVMPLVPWWWDDYVKTGEATTAAPSASKVSGDCASDGSSSVSSTISLTASPHLFRLRCREMQKLPLRRSALSSYNEDFLANSDAVAGVSEAAGKKGPNSVGIKIDARLPGEDLEGPITDPHGEASGEPAIELIHAAAQLVDSLDSWPSDIDALAFAKAGERTKGRGLLLADTFEESTLDGRTTVSPGAAHAPGLFHTHERRSKQMKSSGLADTPKPGSSHGLVTFVSSVLTAPSAEEAESLTGFELLQGALRMLFSFSDALQEDAQQTDASLKDTECTFSERLAFAIYNINGECPPACAVYASDSLCPSRSSLTKISVELCAQSFLPLAATVAAVMRSVCVHTCFFHGPRGSRACCASVFVAAATHQLHAYPQEVVGAVSLAREAVDEDTVTMVERGTETTERSGLGRPTGKDLTSSSTCPTTPLLRSLAASAAPAMQPALGRLAVDDFYANPSSKRAISYRDAYEPFDKDYTDIEIRCAYSPMPNASAGTTFAVFRVCRTS
ncbi:hypothetical protein ACSSS7_001602 [Eimeria intestinalis]